MNHLLKTIPQQFQVRRQADFSSNISSDSSALFGIRGHLIKLNYVIFYCAGKLHKNRSAINIINFIKRLTSPEDIPYPAFAYGKVFSFLYLYYSIVRFAYGKDLSTKFTAFLLHLNSRLFAGKQANALPKIRTLRINSYISLFIAVVKRSEFTPLLHLLFFYGLSVPVVDFIFVAKFLHQPILLPKF